MDVFYLSIGVENIWIVDPWKHRAWTFDGAGWHTIGADGSFQTRDGLHSMPVATYCF